MTPENKKGGELKRVPLLLPGDLPRGNLVRSLDSGVKEAKLLGNDQSREEIAESAARNEHRRSEKFRDNFENIAICGLWLIAIAIALIGATWFYHLIMPDKFHWLSEPAIAKIQNIVTGGVLAAVAGGHLK